MQRPVMRGPGFRSLRSSLTAAFLALVLFVLFFSLGLETYTGLVAQRALVDRQHAIIARDAASDVAAFLDRIALRMDTMTHDPYHCGPERRLHMEKLLGVERAVRHLIMLEPDGTRLEEVSRLSSLSQGALERRVGEAQRSAVMSGTIAYSPVYIDEVTAEPLLIVGTPIVNAFGDVIAGLYAELNLKFIWTVIDGIRIGETGSAYLVDETGRLLAARDVNRVLSGERALDVPEVAEFLRGRGGAPRRGPRYLQRGLDGQYVAANHATLTAPPWALVVETPAREAYHDTIHKLQMTAVIVVTSLLLSVLAARYLAGRATRSIVGLRDAAHSISLGRRDIQVDVRMRNEIGDLAESFSHMLTVLDATTVSRDALAAEVTERRRAEEAAALAMRQAEEASQAKSRFLANMSHELRTPLNAIIGFTSLLEDTNLDTAQRDYVTTVRESGNVLLALINDILDISKVEEGRIELERIPFQLEETLESVLQIVRPRLLGSPVELVWSLGDGPATYVGDPTRIQQVLLNLLSNAIKFTSKGEIAVQVGLDPEDTAGVGQPGLERMLRIVVRDSGIGIPLDQQERVFEVFVQADSSTTRRFGGSGLGLAITKAFVERMGGRIGVVSEPGVGSEFTIMLRLEQGECVGVPERMTGPFAGRSAAVVGTSAAGRAAVREVCAREGIDVVLEESTRTDAETALRELATRGAPLDVLLTDLGLAAGPAGLAAWMAESALFPATRIVAVIDGAVAEVASDTRFHGYLAKPVLRSELRTVLMRALLGAVEGGRRPRVRETLLAGTRLLVAEDNPVNLRLIRRLLERLGATEIDAAPNGREAVAALERRSYDLVLMDVQMPEMTGLEATREIRARLDLTVPIVALTAGALREDRDLALAAGMNDFLTKPIDVEELRRVVGRHVGRLRTSAVPRAQEMDA